MIWEHCFDEVFNFHNKTTSCKGQVPVQLWYVPARRQFVCRTHHYHILLIFHHTRSVVTSLQLKSHSSVSQDASGSCAASCCRLFHPCWFHTAHMREQHMNSAEVTFWFFGRVELCAVGRANKSACAQKHKMHEICTTRKKCTKCAQSTQNAHNVRTMHKITNKHGPPSSRVHLYYWNWYYACIGTQ